MTTNSTPKTAENKRKTQSSYYQTHQTHLGGGKYRNGKTFLEVQREAKGSK